VENGLFSLPTKCKATQKTPGQPLKLVAWTAAVLWALSFGEGPVWLSPSTTIDTVGIPLPPARKYQSHFTNSRPQALSTLFSEAQILLLQNRNRGHAYTSSRAPKDATSHTRSIELSSTSTLSSTASPWTKSRFRSALRPSSNATPTVRNHTKSK
jgi:hypothetical protein